MQRPSSPSEDNHPSPSVLDGNTATFLPRYDETTHTRSSAKDERGKAVPILKETEAAPSTPSVEVNSATPLSQKDKTLERVNSSVEDIQTILMRQDENSADFRSPEQDYRATSSQAVMTAQPLGWIQDDSACEHKGRCALRCWANISTWAKLPNMNVGTLSLIVEKSSTIVARHPWTSLPCKKQSNVSKRQLR